MNAHKLFSIYAQMKDDDIRVYDRSTGLNAVTIYMNGKYGVFLDLDQFETYAQELCILAHEYGHCKTGSTHSVTSPLDLIQKHEYKANKAAVHMLIPYPALCDAINQGYTELWQLAEYFDVTEDFIRVADQIYRNEGLIQ